MERSGLVGRRALLLSGGAVAGGVALGLVGRALGWSPGATVLGSDPNRAIERIALRSCAVLVGAYDAALREPELATEANLPRLTSYREHHAEQLAALGGEERDLAAAPAPGAGSAEVFLPELDPLPQDPAGVPAYFATAEHAQAQLLGTGARIAPDGQLARLLALIVASNTAHIAGWSGG